MRARSVLPFLDCSVSRLYAKTWGGMAATSLFGNSHGNARPRNISIFCREWLTEKLLVPHLQQFLDRKSTRLNSSHQIISYAFFCLKKKKTLTRYNSSS